MNVGPINAKAANGKLADTLLAEFAQGFLGAAINDIGIDGWPILPRKGSPRSSNPSCSKARMITDTVCADRPVIRAISVFAKALCWRTKDSTNRSL